MARFLLTATAILFFVTDASTAFAADGGVDAESFRTILTLLTVVSLAYLVAHLLTGWVSKRFGIVTGVEYIIVGALVGPGFQVLDTEILAQFDPALVLATGSIGLLAGLQLRFRIPEAEGNPWPAALVLSVTTGVCLLVLPLLAYLTLDFGTVFGLTVPHLGILIALGLVADPSPVRSLVEFLNARGPAIDQIRQVAPACSAIAIVVFGAAFCLHRAGTFFDATTGFFLWFGVHLGIGVVIGLIFTAFLMRDYEEEKILAVVIGMVIFTSGLAFYFKLSPIFVNFILGLVLAIFCRNSDKLEKMLLSVERPLYIMLFFFAGALLVTPVAPWAWLLFVPFLVLKWLGRTLGGFVVQRAYRPLRQIPPMGPALWGPGGLSVAMLLDYNQVFGASALAPHLYFALLLSVIVSEMITYRTARQWLIDATDVSLRKSLSWSPREERSGK